MASIEEALNQVEKLGRDLYANISEAVGHLQYETITEERVIGYTCDGYNSYKNWDVPITRPEERIVSSYVVDEPAVPDTQKRESARQQLQQIYESSGWYSARYTAGKALGINLNNDIESWLSKLKLQLNAEKMTTEGGYCTSPYSATGSSYIYEEWTVNITDEATREKAKRDSMYLYENLLDDGQKKKFREILELSKLGIWTDLNPIKTTLTTWAILGAISFLGYFLYNYLTR